MRFIIVVILGFLGFVSANAEHIRGMVLDEAGNPLSYATIRLENQRIATLSDSLGNFGLQIYGVNDSLIISYIGYKTRKFAIESLSDKSVVRFSLEPNVTNLPEVVVYPQSKIKYKNRKKGKKHGWAFLKSCLNGETAGDCFGYEFHSKKNRKLLLDKVGFFYCEGDSQMTKMKFRINIYDMSSVKKSPSSEFINILSKPIYFEYVLNNQLSGKFEYILPDKIELPENAMVEIEFLENLKNEIFWFKSNLIGKRTWSKSIIDGEWEKKPFATPFFIECIELKD